MIVDASMWFEFPGTIAEIRTYASIQAVKLDFTSMVDTYERYGGSKPVGCIYSYGDWDYPIYTIELGPRGGVRLGRT